MRNHRPPSGYARRTQQLVALIDEANGLKNGLREFKKSIRDAQTKAAHQAVAMGWSLPITAAALGLNVQRIKKFLMMKERK